MRFTVGDSFFMPVDGAVKKGTLCRITKVLSADVGAYRARAIGVSLATMSPRLTGRPFLVLERWFQDGKVQL